MPEGSGRVRVGLDAFAQKILGPADEVRLPAVGKIYYQDHICLALMREGLKASIEAPVDGIVEEVNPRVRQRPGLVYEDPYGDGWLFTVRPGNLEHSVSFGWRPIEAYLSGRKRKKEGRAKKGEKGK